MNGGLQQWHSLSAGSGWPARSSPPRPRLCWVSCGWSAAWGYDAAGSIAVKLPTEPGSPWGEWQLSSLLLPHRSWWTCTEAGWQLGSVKCISSSTPIMSVSLGFTLLKCSCSLSPISANVWCKNCHPVWPSTLVAMRGLAKNHVFGWELKKPWNVTSSWFLDFKFILESKPSLLSCSALS